MNSRRSIRLALVALLTLVAATLAPGAITGAGAAATAYTDPLETIGASERAGYGLRWNAVTPETTANLDSKLNNVGVTEVLESANHPARSCNAAERGTLPTAPTASASFCWDTGDATTPDWHPQSITSSGDADDDGAWGTNRLILAGWSYVGTGTGDARYNTVRVAFIDYNNPAAPKYRWVLLVTPTSGGENFARVAAHAGGMAWYGDKLFVSGQQGHTNAIYVFSMEHILQASVNSSAIGKVDGGYSAWGYQYVMPAIGSYSYDAGACTGNVNTAVPCVGSLSLDRSSVPNSLVTTEYLNNGTKGRMLRYNFGSNYLLNSSSAYRLVRPGRPGLPERRGEHAGGPRPQQRLVRRTCLGLVRRPRTPLGTDHDPQRGHLRRHLPVLGRTPGIPDVLAEHGTGLVPDRMGEPADSVRRAPVHAPLLKRGAGRRHTTLTGCRTTASKRYPCVFGTAVSG
ncbi:hypothetical protein ACRJ4B_02990 [Streptomyces sp. GTA36]